MNQYNPMNKWNAMNSHYSVNLQKIIIKIWQVKAPRIWMTRGQKILVIFQSKTLQNPNINFKRFWKRYLTKFLWSFCVCFFSLLESLLQVALAFEAVAETFCLIMAAKLDVHQSPLLLYGYAETPRTLPNFCHFWSICEILQWRYFSIISPIFYVRLKHVYSL